eukprot:CAMPEP_0176024034 /NCGR_PEP_ID=MMETSP0120_2-20121206/11736_1 /TAXON_ID=160619 /ORGANISM="Kryptoperidinium foliaceum, Strain CCMP 1326" /LENGTH=184 /DNA_ID=CAMNT_0017357205 /DNA_START=18 /DNA_END=569 /DNA_ORIENTATION=-
MESAIKLNNDAIDLLSRCCDENSVQEGVILLTQALRTLKQELLARERKGKDCSTDNSEHCQRLVPARCLASIVSCPYSCSRSEESSMHTATNFVYDRMFRLKTVRDAPSPRTIQVYIACVIFNSALLHQHRALELEPGKVRACLLEKATVLYHSCVQILPKTEMTCNGTFSDDLIFSLKVGALN